MRLANDGETIWVCDRDRVVAVLGPPEPTRSARISDAYLAELIRSGYLVPALKGPGEAPKNQAFMPLADLMKELESDRSDR